MGMLKVVVGLPKNYYNYFDQKTVQNDTRATKNRNKDFNLQRKRNSQQTFSSLIFCISKSMQHIESDLRLKMFGICAAKTAGACTADGCMMLVKSVTEKSPSFKQALMRRPET